MMRNKRPCAMIFFNQILFTVVVILMSLVGADAQTNNDFLQNPNITVKGGVEPTTKKKKTNSRLNEIDSQFVHQIVFIIENNAQNIRLDHFENELSEQNPTLNALDSIIRTFEKHEKLKLIIRIKNSGNAAKDRVVYLYNYVFKNSNLKAQQIDIQKFKPKDSDYVWCFENREIAISFDFL